MIKFKTIYQLSFYFIALFIFLFGGTFQFFFGLSNTGLTLVLMSIMFLNYGLYVYLKKKVTKNALLLFAFLYLLVILLSGVINASGFLRILIYTLFPLLPLGIFLFFHINKKENYLKPVALLKFLLIIGYLQLPILLIQRNFYHFLIPFNHSGQYIASFDFLFGSFFLKSDHSLGFFLLALIVSILLNIQNFKSSLKFPAVTLLYLSLTILLAESNISKVLLLLVWGIVFVGFFNRWYKKHKLLRIISLITLSAGFLIFLYALSDSKFVESKLGGSLENNFTPEKSLEFYKEGTAKRLHVIIVYLTKKDFKIIGAGPYSYFDILTGEFEHTIHFSQFIWSYHDLGIIGLITAILYLIFLIKSLNQKSGVQFIFLLICGVYFFFTTIFSEIAILFTLFLMLQTENHELNHHSLSRLEKK